MFISHNNCPISDSLDTHSAQPFLNSGDVDILDALRTLQIAVNLVTPDARERAAGDVRPDRTPGPDGDGKIDVLDALRVLNAAVGNVTITSCGGPAA